MNIEAQKDKQDFQRYQAENTGPLTDLTNSDELVNLLRLLMHQGYLKKYQQNPHQGSDPRGDRPPRNNYQGGQQQDRPARQQNNYHNNQQSNERPRNNYQNNQEHQQRSQPRMQNQLPIPHNNAMGMPMPMPVAGGMPMPMTVGAGMPMPMAPKSGIHTDYLTKTMPILNAVVEQNPNYKQHVGSIIYTFVQGLAGNQAPKITGMLIDLPIYEIHSYMKNYDLLIQRVSEAKELLLGMH